MRFGVQPEPVTDDDDAIRAGVLDAPIPPLLASVAHLTGDRSILRDHLRPDLAKILEPDAGYTAELLDEARQLAADALIRHRDAGSPASPVLDDIALRNLVEFVTGGGIVEDTLPIYETELALDGADLRRPTWSVDPDASSRTARVAVVGAGMSGIIAAHRLQQAGVRVVILEKNADVGGTWFENTYPGCRVDIQNHFYSYSNAQTPDWPQHHSKQAVLLDYFRSCVDRFGLHDSIRFSTEVLEARWDDEASQWQVDVRGPDGGTESILVDAVVSATGQLNRPSMPDIEGIDTFAGPSFHSARWDHAVDLSGKRVAVIGTGASAVQFIPRVAEVAGDLTVFQRTPPWLLPVETYEQDVPSSLRWLLTHVPQFANWDRLWIFARTQEGLLPLATVDPSWDGQGRSVSAENDMVRELLTMYYELVFPDPDLRAKVLPHYPPIAKRVVLDDGRYPMSLQRPNVHLETDAIAEVTPSGVLMADGTLVEVDVIIYGTGFRASQFLTPMRVVGRAGRDLHERWGGDARAYLGITVPEFPNLFLMYGPNTNIVINGSITYFSECQAQFIVEAVGMLFAEGADSMECRPEVHDAYNELIDAGNRERAWGVSSVNTWYRNSHGRIAQNWPFSLVRYWHETNTPDPADYILR